MSEMDYRETSDLVDMILARYSSAANALITSEFERVNDKFADINEKIEGLTEQVKRQNGSVRDLREWKAAHCEETKSLRAKLQEIAATRMARVDIALRYVTIVLAIISVSAAVYFGNQNLKIRKSAETEIHKS